MWESVSVKNVKSWNNTLEGEETCGGKVHETVWSKSRRKSMILQCLLWQLLVLVELLVSVWEVCGCGTFLLMLKNN